MVPYRHRHVANPFEGLDVCDGLTNPRRSFYLRSVSNNDRFMRHSWRHRLSGLGGTPLTILPHVFHPRLHEHPEVVRRVLVISVDGEEAQDVSIANRDALPFRS